MKECRKLEKQENKNSKRSRQSGAITPKQTKWLLVFGIIICVIIVGLFRLKPFSSPASDFTRKQEAAAFLKKEELKLAEQLIREFPNSEVPLVLMGDLQVNRGNSTDGMIFWKKALRLNPNLPDVYCKMAQLASGREEFDKAIELWKKALEINPIMRGVHSDIAKAFMWLGKYTEAIAEAKEEIKISPRSAISYYLLGQGYSQLQEYDKAKRYYERVIELNPNHPNANYGLAGIYIRLKQRDKAKEYMAVYKEWKDGRVKSVWDVDKAGYDLVNSLKSLGTLCMNSDRLYRRMKKERKAEELLKNVEKMFHKAITLAPNQPYIQAYMHRELALVYLRMKRKLAEAQKLAKKAVGFESTAANYYVLCRAFDMNGDSANAQSAIEKAIELAPDNLIYKRMYESIKKKGN
ncbi:MAG: tetratricopeptide repeat protein [Planctomycetota bacterium]|jgi:tetratricopeptide (TPR) repeat protein